MVDSMASASVVLAAGITAVMSLGFTGEAISEFYRIIECP